MRPALRASSRARSAWRREVQGRSGISKSPRKAKEGVGDIGVDLGDGAGEGGDLFRGNVSWDEEGAGDDEGDAGGDDAAGMTNECVSPNG